MVTGVLPGPMSMVIFTSAEPSHSVRSVTRVSAARTASAWLTAPVVFFVAPAPHPVIPAVPASVAATAPAQIAIRLGRMSFHPWLCLCCEAGLYCSAGAPERGPILANFGASTAVLVMR